MLTKKQIQNKVYYDRSTGEFFVIKTKRSRLASDPLGSALNSGYILITVDGIKFMAHHLVMLYEYGIYTDKVIDHIDGNPSNNKKENLRIVSHKVNMKNKATNRNNKTGINGVQLIGGTYYLFVSGKYICSSKSKTEIKKRSVSELKKEGFHKNHGERPPVDVDEIKRKVEVRRKHCRRGDYERAETLKKVRMIRSGNDD